MWRTTPGSGARPCPPHNCTLPSWCMFHPWISESGSKCNRSCWKGFSDASLLPCAIDLASQCRTQVATEKQAKRTFQRLHNTAVQGGAHVLRAQITSPGDWPPGVAPVGDRAVPSLPSYPRHLHRRGGPRHQPARTVANTSWARRVPDCVAPALKLASKAAGGPPAPSSSSSAAGSGSPSLRIPEPPRPPLPSPLVPAPPFDPPPPHLLSGGAQGHCSSDSSEAAHHRPLPPWRQKRTRDE